MQQILTSIIVAVHNQAQCTKLFLQSLSKFTPRSLYELIVIDNNSTDGTSRLLKGICAEIVSLNENVGVAQAWNIGIQKAKGEYLAFIHNDVILTPNWLENMTKPFVDPDIWCVSPRLSRQNTPRDFAYLVHAINSQSSKFTESYLERSCFILRRQALEQLGDFDENLKMYYYDFDYQYRLLKEGHPPVQVTNVAIHHFESRTALSIPDFFLNYKPDAWQYLHQKWNMPYLGSPVEGGRFEEHLKALKAVKTVAKLPQFTIKRSTAQSKPKVKSPRIIACVNVFNELDLLPECIDSLKGMDEIRIVDGAYRDFPHEKPYSTDGTIEWAREQMEKDKRIELITCSKVWENEVEKRNAYFGADEGDWYLVIDADERITCERSDIDPIAELKDFLDGCNLDCFALRASELFQQAGTLQYARIFRHLPGIRLEACHYNVIAEGDRYLWLEVEEGGNLLLYSGFYLLHVKCVRNADRLNKVNRYYETKNIKEAIALGELIREHFSDSSKAKALRAWIKMYNHLTSQISPQALKNAAIDQKYLCLPDT